MVIKLSLFDQKIGKLFVMLLLGIFATVMISGIAEAPQITKLL